MVIVTEIVMIAVGTTLVSTTLFSGGYAYYLKFMKKNELFDDSSSYNSDSSIMIDNQSIIIND